MEDSGVDIIFYIIAGLLALISAIGRKKKKPTQGAPAASPEQRKRRFEQIIENLMTVPEETDELQYETEYLEEQASEEVVFESVTERSTAADISQESFIDQPDMERLDSIGTDEFGLIDEGIISIKTNDAKEYEPDEYEISDSESWASQLAEDFDLSEGIIYSEILTRKEIF